VGRLFKKSTSRAFGRSWGYLLLPIILWAWFIAQLDPRLIAILSVLATTYFLFQARVPCGAETRDIDPETGMHLLCRKNATGILGGCGYKSHRWQNLKLLVRRSTWGRLGQSLFRKAAGAAATLSALATVASAVIALGALFVAMAKPT